MRAYIRLGLLVAVVGALLVASAGTGASPGITTRVSVDSAGNQGDDASYSPAISADGRYVAFGSKASNLVPGDTNGTYDVFVHDRHTGVTERVSVDSAGNEGNDQSWGPAISTDGRYVAFGSWASNLVPGDTNGTYDVFVHDRHTGITERVSVDTAGVQANDQSGSPAISADGRYVAFHSWASNLVADDTNTCETWPKPGQCPDVFVHDRQTGITERVSVDSAGNQGNGRSGGPAMSADGRYVAFSSRASNLVADDTNGAWDAFVHDRDTGATRRVSVDSSGKQWNRSSGGSAMSADGRYVALYSEFAGPISCLPPGYGPGEGYEGCSEVFVHDRQTGTTEWVSVDSGGSPGNGHSQAPAISADGRCVAFDSYASNLVPGDTRDRDIFVHDRQTGVTEQVSVDSAGVQGNDDSWAPAISADGRYVAFLSDASNLVPDDTNDSPDVFVRDRGEAPAPVPTPTPGRLTVCPSAGKWAISVWDGPSGTATGDALTTCADVSIDAVYWLDPATQLWWRYFPELLDISNLLTLDALQPIIIRGR
jgi:Tol biopolymer transport system component